MKVHTPAHEITAITLGVPGEHSVTNALLAFAVGNELGMNASLMAEALAKLQPAGMRLHIIDVPSRNIRIINDAYNANPESVAAALRTLATMNTTGKRIAILGDMLELGSESPRAHLEILTLARDLDIDEIYIYGKHFSQASEGIDAPEHVFRSLGEGGGDSEGSSSAVILGQVGQTDGGTPEEHLLPHPGDLILVKGSRGMKMERVVEALTDTRSDEC